jgi:hypothetical protein
MATHADPHRFSRATAGGPATWGSFRLGYGSLDVLAPGFEWPLGEPGAPLVTTSVAVALVPALLGSAALSAPNAPLDAARLDIMPAGLWGRAESVRTVLRASAVAAAPLLFGWLADRLGGGADGVRWTFLIMLVPLACSGLVLLRAGRSYPRDTATAMAAAGHDGDRVTSG